MKKFQIILLLILTINKAFNQIDTLNNFKNDSLYILGKIDGKKVKLKSNPGIASFIFTAAHPPIGAIFTIVASTKTPKIESYLLENVNSNNKMYIKGFSKGMKSKKNKRLWTGACIAGGGYAALFLAFITSMHGK